MRVGRKIVEAEKVAPEIAQQAVALIGTLFAVERKARDCSDEKRLALRQAQSVPVLANLRRSFWDGNSHKEMIRATSPAFVKAGIFDQDGQVVAAAVVARIRARWTSCHIVPANLPHRPHVLQNAKLWPSIPPFSFN